MDEPAMEIRDSVILILEMVVAELVESILKGEARIQGKGWK